MNGLIRLMIAGLSMLPAPVLAQALTRADLVGTWLYTTYNTPAAGQTSPQIYERILTLQADGTWTTAVRVNGKDADKDMKWEISIAEGKSSSGRWYSSEDSLWFSDPTKADDRVSSVNIVARQDQQLLVGEHDLMFQNDIAPLRYLCPFVGVFQRASLPLPPPILPPPTLKATALAGTWVNVTPEWGRGLGGDTVWMVWDTLTFRPDGIWTHRTGKDMTVATGSWSLLAGDILWRRNQNDDSFTKLVLQGARLSLYPTEPRSWPRRYGRQCDEPDVYRRVGP